MYQSDTEILFPMRVAPNLRNLRGEEWRHLVESVITEPDASLGQLAFSLLLVRLSGCLTCHTDSYRAMRGCTICATQVIRRFKGDDEDLLLQFHHAQADVQKFLRVDVETREVREGVFIGG
ncbi:MAG: hypothetical protein GTO18_09495 [Anaerolineales bacterium]|nr:hypothetical protein [Anaerolineales bacterium]